MEVKSSKEKNETLISIEEEYIDRFYNPEFSSYDFMSLFCAIYGSEQSDWFDRDVLLAFIQSCKKNGKYENLLNELQLKNNGVFCYSEDFEEAITKLKFGGILYTISPEQDAGIYIKKDVPFDKLINPREKYEDEMREFIGNFDTYRVLEKPKIFDKK